MDKMSKLHNQIQTLRDELRAQGEQVDDAAAAALCETSAEVLQGLMTTFEHFADKSEAAWQK
jgi:hypothetical protein